MFLEPRYNAKLDGTFELLPASEVVDANLYVPMRELRCPFRTAPEFY